MKKLTVVLFVKNEKIENQIMELIQKFSSIKDYVILHNDIEVIENLNSHEYDILFLNIENEEILRKVNKPPFIVGLSSSIKKLSEMLNRGFFDIICQPIQEIHFCNIMSKIIKIANVYNVQQEIIPIAAESVVPYNRPNEAIRPDDHIFIKFNKSSIKVKYDEILYIKNAGNTLKIETTTGKPFYYRSTLKKFYESLPTHTFTRINKSIVVNYTKIDKYKNQTVYIQNETFKVSRIYSVRLKELLRLR